MQGQIDGPAKWTDHYGHLILVADSMDELRKLLAQGHGSDWVTHGNAYLGWRDNGFVYCQWVARTTQPISPDPVQ